MTDWWAALLAATGLLLATFSAIGGKTLLHFSHRQLEVLSQARQMRRRYGQILDLHDEAALAAETVQILCSIMFFVFGAYWLHLTDTAQQPAYVAGMILAVSFTLILATVWLPWAITRHSAAAFLLRTWPMWLVLYRLMLPLSWLGRGCDTIVRRLTGKPRKPEREADGEAIEDEIMTMVTAAQREGLLQEDALEMIEGVFELDDSDVADIMTPRLRVNVLESDMPWGDMLREIIEFGNTRLPVCEPKSDRVIGILYAKDVLTELAKDPDQPRRPLDAILRDPIFFPKTLPLNDALQRFLQSHKHMAIVNDEFNGFIGVVTIEDVLEEIVGEIDDEYDKEDHREIVRLPDGKYEAVGNLHLDDLSEEIGLELDDSHDYDTVGGLVVNQLGRIPQNGETVWVENLEITVLLANPRHIERVLIQIHNESEINRT